MPCPRPYPYLRHWSHPARFAEGGRPLVGGVLEDQPDHRAIPGRFPGPGRDAVAPEATADLTDRAPLLTDPLEDRPHDPRERDDPQLGRRAAQEVRDEEELVGILRRELGPGRLDDADLELEACPGTRRQRPHRGDPALADEERPCKPVLHGRDEEHGARPVAPFVHAGRYNNGAIDGSHSAGSNAEFCPRLS